MNNVIGETGAVFSPAVSGALRDATGAWSAAVFVDAGLIACAVLLLLCVREGAKSRVLGREGPDAGQARAPALVGGDEGPRFTRGQRDRPTPAERR